MIANLSFKIGKKRILLTALSSLIIATDLSAEITLDLIKRALSDQVFMKLDDPNAYAAAEVIRFEIVSRWQQSDGVVKLTRAEIEAFQHYSSSTLKDLQLDLEKAETKLDYCKEIVRAGSYQIVFNSNGIHIIHNSIKLSDASYHVLAPGVFFQNLVEAK